MTTQITLKCPGCGGTDFEHEDTAASLDEVIGSECANCKRRLTENDVNKQIEKAGEKEIEKMLRDAGFPKNITIKI